MADGTDEEALAGVEARLGRIEDALERLESGDYRLCKACGGEIPDEVLVADPAAPYCARCARAPQGV